MSKPSEGLPVPAGDLAYMRVRNRYRAHELVLKEFVKSSLSQADLARRLGRKPDMVCRWLGAPGNWTLDTVSDLLFAISGAEVDYGLAYPADLPARNHSAPAWLADRLEFPIEIGTASTSETASRAPEITLRVLEPA